MEGSCEHGNEPLGSIKCWEVLQWVHNWRLLKKGSAPCVSDVRRRTALFQWKRMPYEDGVFCRTGTLVLPMSLNSKVVEGAWFSS
jgi:hypothetical protein